MLFESIQKKVSKKSLRKLSVVQELKEELNENYKIFLDLKQILEKDKAPKESVERVNKILNTYTKDIKVIEKFERKATSYKKIKFKYDGDYDSSITRVIFPKGTKMKFKKEWLKNNDYPIKNHYYNIDSMYDCTGRVCAVYVKYKANIVEIESMYDV